jgi:hypothetical protein
VPAKRINETATVDVAMRLFFLSVLTQLYSEWHGMALGVFGGIS